jgi:hypothetical protein
MNELNIREKWNYTQKPENERKFTFEEMANALDITKSKLYGLIDKLDLDSSYGKNARGHKVLIFTYEAFRQCAEELERNEAAEKEKKVKPSYEASQAEHPLVTDPRFLKLSFFPDVIPACFQEAE